MSRPTLLLILVVLLLLAGLFFLSTRVEPIPTKTIEVEVSPTANAQ